MEGFFRALSDFLKSDLAKSHGWVILVTIILCVSIIGVVMWFVLINIVVPAKTIEANNIKQGYKTLIEENKALKEENSMLKEKLLRYRYIESLQEEPDNDFEDNALKKFL